MTTRRETIAGGIAGIAMLAMAGEAKALGKKAQAMMMNASKPTYGLVGQMKAKPGQRDALIAALTEGNQHMPGNIAYIVGADLADKDGIWITELWLDKASHDASLKLPQVQAAIAKGRPMIAGMGVSAEFLPA